ncbi:NAD(P)-binding protein [Dichomitus squalens LYAD-421 SS1]|uniref:NAD(P)-binding protein n=1 Tax=Dichomitus squalens (strain LYAD-421) TaxID=732165 RepID=R7SV66_DICSQ|nr:NAD(P)-binding protein [Dichomitus squalens LYAD-421 SS1]EJF58867.1 NAD(P)-binding protein [Dichomitus squalens LYAD-421 SS1]
MSSSKLVLVTCASGYIASHVVQQLLSAGYRVRGTARGAKVNTLRDFWKAVPEFQAIQIDDIATDDFTEALQGVDAVVHVPASQLNKDSADSLIKASVSVIDGTLNVIRQANDKGVKKLVLNSSWVTLLSPDLSESYKGITLFEETWGKTSREDLIQHDGKSIYAYFGAQILAEQAVWAFSKEHLDIDIATLLPPFVFGPPVLPLSKSSLSSVGFIYKLIAGEAGGPLPFQTPPFHVDARDIARAHVRALELPPLPAGADRQEKRFLVSSPETFTWDVAVKHLYEARPGLRNRLPSLEKAVELPGPLSKNDTTRAKQVLGITEYVDWRKTVEDTIDALVEAEKTWA